jgi:small-conductance mechanosensitive channel
MTDQPALAPLAPGLRFLRVAWRMLAPLAVALNLVAWPWILGASDALKHQALVAAGILLGFALLMALIQEVLSPRNAALRVVPMADHRAERLTAIARAVLLVLLGTELAIYVVRANDWSESVASLLALVRTVGLIAFGWAALSRSGLLHRLVPGDRDTYRGLLLWLLVRIVFPLAMLTILFYVIVNAFGYRALSIWVVRSATWTAVLVVGAALVYRFLRKRVRVALSFVRDEQSVTEDEQGGEGTERAPTWIGVERILAGTLKLAVVIASFFIGLALWDLDVSRLGSFLGQPIVAGGALTWGTLVTGFGRAAVVLIAHAFVRNILIFFVFPRTGVEIGARYAMLTVLRYGAVVLIVLFVMGAFGVGTSTLAVFAGGATVGLAFGLKDIFSNFFSGLIMLLERPVRVGDTVEVSGTKGKIEAIRLRGTTIRTFDGPTVIIPNTHMIGERLTNLSYGLETVRMQINVGVSYGSDPAEVQKVLLDIARADPRVIHDPEPVVRFDNFGDSSLDFVVRVWTRELAERWALVSEMREKIFQAFADAKIEIPFPQRDLHIRSDDTRAGPSAEPA